MSEVIERPTTKNVEQEEPFVPPPYPRFFKPMEHGYGVLHGGRVDECVCARVDKRDGAVVYRIPHEWVGCMCGRCCESTMDMDVALGFWAEISPDEALLIIGGAL